MFLRVPVVESERLIQSIHEADEDIQGARGECWATE